MRLLLLAVILLCIGAAKASDRPSMTLLQLHSFCASKDSTDNISCVAFFSGFIQGLKFGTSGTQAGKPFCLPDNITVDQGILILNKIVRDGPQFAGLEAVPALALYFQSAFPCPRSR